MFTKKNDSFIAQPFGAVLFYFLTYGNKKGTM